MPRAVNRINTVTSLMPENSLKLMSTNHHVRCIVSLGTLTCYQLKIFFTFKKEKHKVHGNKVLALARLTLKESVNWGRKKCPLSALTGVRIKWV